jgi:ribosomal protein S18 acetylase RimI-like enzyme
MRSDVDALYGAMDIFVLPSYREGFPRAAMEAAASGIPIVATDIRGCREVVAHGENGLLVPVRDGDALAAAVTRLSDDADLRTRMGEAGRAKAEREFDERTIVHTVVAAQVRALREKGRFERFDDRNTFPIRPAEPRDAPVLARLHADGIDTGFLPRLGVGFLEHLYRQMLDSPESVVLVAEDDYAPVGFVAGTTNVDALYRAFVRRRGIRAATAASFRLARPSTIRRAWETYRYDGDHLDTPAELLSMAVADPFRGRGTGKALGIAFLEAMTARGVDRVKVVVGADNEGALAAYRSMGFIAAGTIEVHAGEPSVAMIWDQAS